MATPAVSIITVVLNDCVGLQLTCASIAAQTDCDWEHLIVDGGSRDGTADLISHLPQVRWWCSEPDRGISHAFNKGIAQARGDLIALINAGDLMTPGSLARSHATLAAAPDAGFAFGHCRHTTPGAPDWLNLADPHYRRRLLERMPDVNHPTWVVRRGIYQRLGGYAERWRLAMDYEYLLRMSAAGIRGARIDAVQAVMAMGGLSDRRWIAACDEVRRIAVRYGAHPGIAAMRMSFFIGRGICRRRMSAWGMHRLVDRIRTLGRQRALGISPPPADAGAAIPATGPGKDASESA